MGRAPADAVSRSIDLARDGHQDRLGQVALAQIAYWTFGALWPLINIHSFEKITGHKREDWLVRTVALMMLSVVVSLDTMRRTRRDDAAMRVLGATSTAALGGVALVGPLVGRISPVYLMDALVDAALFVGWIVGDRILPLTRREERLG